MKRILTELLYLFFPNTCVNCKSPLIIGEEQLCIACLNQLSYTRFNVNQNPAELLFAGRNEISAAYAFLHYEKGGITQKLIFSLKYHNNKKLGFLLGRMAALQLIRQVDFEQPDVIIPVPLHKKRLKKRGYNQSEWIAKGFNSVCRKSIDTTSLIRLKKTETQTKKSVYDRITGIETAFQLTSGENLEGKHVLLIDDVMTSGATLNACVKELSRCEKIKISIFCLAVAQ